MSEKLKDISDENLSWSFAPAGVSVEDVKDALDYDHLTGDFTWKTRPLSTFSGPRAAHACKSWNAKYPGKKTGHYRDGYIRIRIRNKSIAAHRVAWAIYYGEWPMGYIDHINGRCDDNRIKNLRVANFRQSNCNVSPTHNGSSGYLGVSRKAGKWRASIQENKRWFHLGVFETEKEAFAAYKGAARILHGKYVSTRLVREISRKT